MVMPPMLTPVHPKAMPKGYQASSSVAVGAQREDYDDAFGPSAAAASETDPGTTERDRQEPRHRRGRASLRIPQCVADAATLW